MDENSSFKFECIRCGKCCSDQYTIVNLTFGDLKRLKYRLKLNSNELLEITSFYLFKEQVSSEIIEKMVIPPINTEKGKSFIALRKVEGGKCIFYHPETKKCRVYSIRPCFCRTFPFSYNLTHNNNIRIMITNKGMEYCPGLNEKSPLINMEVWKALGIKALQELETNAKLVSKWNEQVKNPTAKGFLETYI